MQPEALEPLFLGAVDGTLKPGEREALAAALAADPALAERLRAYRAAVARLRAAPRPEAPAALADQVLRRSRRRRRGRGAAEEALRVPAEVLLPVLLGALAALLYLGLA